MEPRRRIAPIRVWLASVFALALVVRGAYLLEIRGVPLVRFPVIDAETYLQWARQIAAGDWLGSEPFYQAPLYPYFLGVTMRIVGDHPLAIRFVQALIGAISCVVLASACRRLFSDAAGLTAGCMLALYPPSIFLGTLIQKTVLDELGFAAMIWLISRVRPNKPMIIHAALGVTLAALSLTRENALLLLPVVAIWVYFVGGGPDAARLRLARIAALGIGAAAILGVVVWRNYAVCGDWLITTYQGGPNFYIGNNPDANGSYVALSAGRGQTRYERIDAIRIAQAALGRELSPREVSSFWYRQAFEFVQSEPLRWLRLTAYKLLLALNAYEIPDSEDQAFYAAHSGLLSGLAPIWHFGVLLPLAIAGFTLMRPMNTESRLIAVIATIFLASTTAFFVLARYRYPLVPLMLPFAAVAAVEIARRVHAREFNSLRYGIAAALIIAIPANWPTPFPARAELATSYTNAGISLAGAGEPDAAETYLKKALEIEPNKASAHFGMGQIWTLRRKPQPAIAAFERALVAQPDVPHFLAAMGTAKLMAQDVDSAIDYLQRSVAGDPFNPAPWTNLAEAHRRQKGWAEAIDALRRGAESNPDDLELRLRLAWFLATAPDDRVRDGATAVSVCESIVASMQAPTAAVLDVLAASYAEIGRFDDAVQIARRALDLCGSDMRLAERISARLTNYGAGRAARIE